MHTSTVDPSKGIHYSMKKNQIFPNLLFSSKLKRLKGGWEGRNSPKRSE